jgi:predicted phage tail protein
VIAGIGFSLALGGVAQLLTPVPRMAGPGVALGGGAGSAVMGGSANSAKAEDNDPRKNYSFSGIQNNSRAGLPVPIGFGEVIVGSIVISQSIDVDQVAV